MMNHVPLLFDEWRQESPFVAIVRRLSSVPDCLWFIGDVHGDLAALERAWRYIQTQSALAVQTPHVVFLGDFLDRGPHVHESLRFLFHLFAEYPQQIGIVAGNHDVELSWDAEAQVFRSFLKPADYTDALNTLLGRDDPESQARFEMAHRAIALFRQCPRALLLPDGLLVTHAGFPHVDLMDTLQRAADLSRPECLQDFSWLRLSDSPRKVPNRSHRGCEFGFEDFGRFCDWTKTRLGLGVERMIRGHDHFSERYRIHERYTAHPVLTLNTMGTRLEDEWLETEMTPVCVGKHVPGQLPEVHQA